MLAFAVQIARGLSPGERRLFDGIQSQPPPNWCQAPPNWCQAHKSGGPGVLAFAVQIARGLSPGERRLFDGI